MDLTPRRELAVEARAPAFRRTWAAVDAPGRCGSPRSGALVLAPRAAALWRPWAVPVALPPVITSTQKHSGCCRRAGPLWKPALWRPRMEHPEFVVLSALVYELV